MAVARSVLLALVMLRHVFSSTVTPAQQVINMLVQMRAKGQQMLEDEKKVFAAYQEWADDRAKDLALEIQTQTAKIEELTAVATKADSDAAELGRQVEQLGLEIDRLEAERKEAAEDRAGQHAEYLKASADYAESVDALQRAIQTLAVQDYDRPQAEALLQRMAKRSRGMSRALAGLLQETSRGSLRGDGGAPEVAAYESQSGGITALLTQLLKKFRTELADTEQAESNEAHAHALADLHLSNTIARDKSDRDEKAVARAQRAEVSARSKGELASTVADKASGEQLKADTESTLATKAGQFEENQKVRAAELEAIDQAVSILSSPEVADSYAKHVALMQKGAAASSFLQLAGSGRRLASKDRAAQLLRRRALALHSRALLAAAADIAANPFGKVIGMIESLLAAMKAEAASEADHKAWCDGELQANKMKRDKKTAEANKLTADVENLDATVAEMGAAIAVLLKEQVDLTTAMGEATKLREAEKAENQATITDATAGAEAVKKALVLLKEFYQGQAAGAALLQRRQVPEMAAYKGMQSAKGGVIGMLEVVGADFSRLRSETEANEHTAAAEYDRFMQESTAAKTAKHEAEVKLKLDKDQAEFERSRTQKDLTSTNEELGKASEYFEALKPACLEVHVSYEERVSQRKAEIEALKEAYGLLDQKSAE